jgi:predicted nucleic acid-binding protein
LAHFIDTNIAVYALLPGPNAERALAVLSGAVISVQVLNEFASVSLRKFGLTESDLDRKIAELRGEVDAIAVIDEPTHDLARRIAFRYKLAFYDSALLASALLADCDVFYSEDMRKGMVIENCLTIRNPFL